MATPTETIVQAITDPAAAAGDGQSVSSRSAADIIALLNYQATLTTIGKRRRSIRYTHLINPGALDDRGRSTVQNSNWPY